MRIRWTFSQENDLVKIIEELNDKLDCHPDENELSKHYRFIEDPHSDENEQENDFEECISSSIVLSTILILIKAMNSMVLVFMKI